MPRDPHQTDVDAPLHRRVLGGERAGAVVLAALALLTAVVCALAMARANARPRLDGVTEVKAPPLTSTAKPLKVVFLGDSYVDAAGPTHPRWSSILSAKRGWTEVNLGKGGSSYSTEFAGRYAEAPADADMVIVFGGRNDGSFKPEAIKSFYAKLRHQLPNAKLVAIAPQGDARPAPEWLAKDAHDAVRDAVTSAGGSFVDPGQVLYQHPELVQADQVHPTEDGHRAIAAAIDAKLP